MRLLVLDQTGELGGAELSLLAEVTNMSHVATVLLFQDGPLRPLLQARGIAVEAFSSGRLALRVATRH